MKKTMIAVLVGAILTACTNLPHKTQDANSKQSLPNFNYVVEGGEKWGLVQVFELHNKTYVQFLDLDRANPVFIGPDGEEISHTRNGMYAVLDTSISSFNVVSAYGRAKVSARSTSPLPLDMVASETPDPDANSTGAGPVLDKPTASVLTQALDYSARQLQELKVFAAQNVGDPTVKHRLDLIEKRLALLNEAIEVGHLPVFHVYFDDNATVFSPDSETYEFLILAAKESDKVLIRGYTDSNTLTPAARKLAVLRTQSAKKYFQDAGVNPAKIRTAFLSAGGHVALNTPAGRHYNRRVDILLKFPETDIKKGPASVLWQGKAFK